MKYILLTTLILTTGFLNQQAQEKSKDEIVVKTTLKDGGKKEKTINVISGDNLEDIQLLIDSLMKSEDWEGDITSKMNIIRIPGTDGFEILNWIELNDLGEIGDFNIFEQEMKWLDMKRDKADKPFLGVILDTDSKLENGIHIMDIVNSSAADEAGLQKDDILLRIGEDDINSLEDLVVVLKELKIGDEIDITYLRSGSEGIAKAKLKSQLESDYNITNSFNSMLPDCCKTDSILCQHTSDKVYKAFVHQERPKLGVLIEDLDQEMIDDLRIPDGKGVLVTKVLNESTAKKMGIKINDVLISLNETEISNINVLHDLLGNQKLGDEIMIDIIRYGERKTLSGVLFEFNHHSTIDRMIFWGGDDD